MVVKNLEILRKRLLYQSQHRGMKEMDIILGDFAQELLQRMSYKELHQFEDLLAFSDQDLYGWIFEKAPIAADGPQELVKMLVDFIENP